MALMAHGTGGEWAAALHFSARMNVSTVRTGPVSVLFMTYVRTELPLSKRFSRKKKFYPVGTNVEGK